MLSVIPSERALWQRLDEAFGELHWRMIFSELGKSDALFPKPFGRHRQRRASARLRLK
jgi:hypothetical protein